MEDATMWNTLPELSSQNTLIPGASVIGNAKAA